MSFFEMMRSAIRGILSSKLRSILTLLGVLIGVAAVILLLAVGNGSAQQINSLITQLGTNTLTVRPVAGSAGTSQPLTIDVGDKLAASKLGHVAAVVPQSNTSQTVSSSGVSLTGISIVGTTPAYFTVSTSKVASGSSFSDDDVTSAAKVAIIGTTLATQLFPGQSALGQQITVDGTVFTVNGILAEQSVTGNNDPNAVVIAPITRVQRSFTGFRAVSALIVQATSADDVAAAQGEVQIMLTQLLKVKSTTTSPFTVTNQTALLATRAQSAQTFTVLLGAVAAISLLVGGIGVTNVMLVTVTERTREIGIRKALGATRGAILGQFLAEAATLTLLGGILGVVVAVIGAQFPINGTQPVILAYSIPLALGVSVAIGIFFGVYPAARAAAMRPIQALRAI
jgi:putative ABC transport system permease protein